MLHHHFTTKHCVQYLDVLDCRTLANRTNTINYPKMPAKLHTCQLHELTAGRK